MVTSITFYYDVMSPYSFLAFHQLLQLQTLWPGIEIQYRPVQLFDIMKESGNRSPAAIPAKRKWLIEDLRRAADDLEIQGFRPPETLFNTLNAMLLLTALRHEKSALIKATSAIYQYIFIDGQKDMSLAALKEVCRKHLPNNVLCQAIEMASKPETANCLKKTTAEVLAQGAFGLPVLIVRNDGQPGQFFFGSDRWHQIAKVVGQSWPPLRSRL